MQVDVTAVLNRGRLSTIQARVLVLGTLAIVFDGFDIQLIGFAAYGDCVGLAHDQRSAWPIDGSGPPGDDRGRRDRRLVRRSLGSQGDTHRQHAFFRCTDIADRRLRQSDADDRTAYFVRHWFWRCATECDGTRGRVHANASARAGDCVGRRWNAAARARGFARGTVRTTQCRSRRYTESWGLARVSELLTPRGDCHTGHVCSIGSGGEQRGRTSWSLRACGDGLSDKPQSHGDRLGGECRTCWRHRQRTPAALSARRSSSTSESVGCVSLGASDELSFPDSSQCRSKLRPYWPGVMPVPLRNARVKFA
jgi:hypothetical protein